jgi:hypothetical protein
MMAVAFTATSIYVINTAFAHTGNSCHYRGAEPPSSAPNKTKKTEADSILDNIDRTPEAER